VKKKRKISENLGDEVAALRSSLGLSQGELAQKLGVGRSAVSACEIGRIVLAPAALVKLAKLSPAKRQRLFFLEQVGLNKEIVVDIADLAFEIRMEPPAPGEVIRVPRFRFTEDGRESAGDDVPLPSEFIPNPAATVCFISDSAAGQILHCPKGLVILDTTQEGTQDLTDLWEHVIALRYAPVYPLQVDPFDYQSGVYVGRLHLTDHAWGPRGTDVAGVTADLLTLESEGGFEMMHLGSYAERDGMNGIAPEDREARLLRMKEIRDRGAGNLSLEGEFTVLGTVIGRMSGHIPRRG
jgi:transcriptional regulator with XRE-family HTH domain